MKFKSILIGSCFFLYSGHTLAALITYDYSFDTPEFNEFPFGSMNDLLQLAGSTTTGSITLDTDKISARDPVGNRDQYAVSSGGLTHSGELDELGFDTQASSVITPYLESNPGTSLLSISGWTLQDSEIQLSLEIDFARLRIAAQCIDFTRDPVTNLYDGCADPDPFNQGYANYRPLTNLSLAQVPESLPPVPAPPALLLFGTGILGLVFARRKQKQGSSPVNS